MTSLIRPEATTDCAAIEALIECAFLHAEHSSHTEHLIVNALRRAGQLSVSLVAEADERVVGHVAVSPVQVSDGSAAWFGLGPIAVLPAFRQHGVGSAFAAPRWRRCKGRAPPVACSWAIRGSMRALAFARCRSCGWPMCHLRTFRRCTGLGTCQKVKCGTTRHLMPHPDGQYESSAARIWMAMTRYC